MFRDQTPREIRIQSEREGGGPIRDVRRPILSCKDKCARLPEHTKDQRRQRNNCYVNCKQSKQTAVWEIPLRSSEIARMGVSSSRRSSSRRSSSRRASPRKASPRRSSPRRASPRKARVSKSPRSPSARGISRKECKSRCRNLPTKTKLQRRQKNNCYTNCKK